MRFARCWTLAALGFLGLARPAIAEQAQAINAAVQTTDKPRGGEAAEDAQPRHFTVATAARRMGYTATPGTLTIRDDSGAPIASAFYVAYVADVAKGDAPRPVTFLFNGGPGTSTLWLHMGSFGPVRIDTPTTDPVLAPPYAIKENPETLLERTDLVFLDSLGTGFSRAIGGAKDPDFWNVDRDLDFFERAIERYLTINDRWDAPKFLLGESYGTTRAAGLAYMLQRRGVQVSGVVLLSSVLNLGGFQTNEDRLPISYLPTYAATAWYHHRIPNRPATLEPFLTDVRNWARGPYLLALAQGSRLSSDSRDVIAKQMSAYIGLSVQLVLDHDLRIDRSAFLTSLLRDQGQVVGELDGRFSGPANDAASARPEFDPSYGAISAPYVSALNKHLFGTLGYKTNLAYRPYNNDIGAQWKWNHRGPDGNQRLVATNVDLAFAMQLNRNMRVLSANGYYDFSTPFAGTEYDLDHMQLAPSLRKNITIRYYEAGHMIYINPKAMTEIRRDLDDFYEAATTR